MEDQNNGNQEQNQQLLDNNKVQDNSLSNRFNRKVMLDEDDENQRIPNVCAYEKQKDFREKMDESQKAMRKLLCAATVCLFFCIFEFIGGIISNSNAVMTDSAHMLSDVFGFAISYWAVSLGKNPSTGIKSYGYHRAEVLGAAASIFFIWGLLIYLNVNATLKIIYPEDNLNGKVMFICSCVGLTCNIINILQLGDPCGSSDEEGGEGSIYYSKIVSVYKPFNLDSKNKSIVQKLTDSLVGGSKVDAKNRKKNTAFQEVKGNPKSSTKDSEDKQGLKNSQIQDGENQQMTTEAQEIGGKDQEKKEGENRDDLEIQPQFKDLDIEEVDEFDPKKNRGQGDGENINVRAAIVHIMGDMVQSIGVIIAGTLVWIDSEKFKLADPICTYFFSVLVMLTTVPIMKDVIRILMESTPDDMNVMECYNRILTIKGVEEIHDFHVWCMSAGKKCMSCHVRSNEDPEIIIHKINEIMRFSYEVYHNTIQVEKSIPHAKEISCENFVDHKSK